MKKYRYVKNCVNNNGWCSQHGWLSCRFIMLFTEVIGHFILRFNCIIHQEVLCAKVGLKELSNVTSIVTKVARALVKRKFTLPLREVNSAYD